MAGFWKIPPGILLRRVLTGSGFTAATSRGGLRTKGAVEVEVGTALKPAAGRGSSLGHVLEGRK